MTSWYLRLAVALADTKSLFLRLSFIAFLYYSLLAVSVVGRVFSGASGRLPLYGVLWTCMAPLLYLYTPGPLLSLYALLVSSSAPLYTALESVCVVLLADAVSRYLHRFICSSDVRTSSSAKAAVLILSAAGALLSYVPPYASVCFKPSFIIGCSINSICEISTFVPHPEQHRSMMWRAFLNAEPVASEIGSVQQWIMRLLPFVRVCCLRSMVRSFTDCRCAQSAWCR